MRHATQYATSSFVYVLTLLIADGLHRAMPNRKFKRRQSAHGHVQSRALDHAFKVIAEHELPLSEIVLQIALKQLGRSGGSITRVARLLGVNRRTLQRKLKRGFARRRRKRQQRRR